ncbi:MAG: NUDIX domain-containing protein [Planctomycetota bacterium]|nr:NUDIX domain-containing protein [Planctomycetota bacterium]
MLNTSEEFFDVVDKNDDVIEQLPRSEVHRRKLQHRAVHVFLFRSDGWLLIHKRSDTKEEFPSVWTSSCSGHVSAGEDYEAAAVRELFEELGVKSVVARLQKFAACVDTSQEFSVLYQGRCDSDIKPDADEIAAVHWMSVDAIRRWMMASPNDFSPAFRLLFGWYLAERPYVKTPENR